MPLRSSYRYITALTVLLLAHVSTVQHADAQAASPVKGSRIVSTISWNESAGTPSLITGALSNPSRHSPGWIAYEFVTANKKLYGLRNPKQDLVITQTTKSDSGDAIVEFKRVLFGTPVWGDVLAITIDSSGIVTRAEGIIHPNLEKRLFHRAHHAAVTPHQALSIAMKQVLPTVCTLKPEIQTYYYPLQASVPLIYAVALCASDPHNQAYTLIHSLSGRIIAQPYK
ncbi:hypothetical protein PCCS19_58190 [Paenibacillus sp. CCS19]|uniref:hypothetical protein n=1 Tax=Paenibacillus sp. CCS19 TaxID=3158387 RepID=UPI002564F8CF|nr:hypothetical protein [Paenibacillus cellulosilyticus]GMK42759.1 hypothetical protein PCCS19_58190 [Paenibacillus cellulosilyticus]